jgi:hypothetical protein
MRAGCAVEPCAPTVRLNDAADYATERMRRLCRPKWRAGFATERTLPTLPLNEASRFGRERGQPGCDKANLSL